MNMMNLIAMYLNDKQLAWASSTLKSEQHRLNAAAPMLNGNPMKLWKSLEHHGAYGRTTIWTRVTDFWQWCIDCGHIAGPNPYKAFRSKNAKQFKNVYTKKTPEISFEEACARIETIRNVAHRERARTLINTGMRYTESCNVQESGTVVGKGGRTRSVYLPDSGSSNGYIQYRSFLRSLSSVGLKPHDLRKIFLSRLVEMGANEFELREIAGWASLAPATSYIKANDDRIKKLVQQVQGGQSVSNTEKQVS